MELVTKHLPRTSLLSALLLFVIASAAWQSRLLQPFCFLSLRARRGNLAYCNPFAFYHYQRSLAILLTVALLLFVIASAAWQSRLLQPFCFLSLRARRGNLAYCNPFAFYHYQRSLAILLTVALLLFIITSAAWQCRLLQPFCFLSLPEQRGNLAYCHYTEN